MRKVFHTTRALSFEVKELVEKKKIKITYMPTDQMTSDFMTKQKVMTPMSRRKEEKKKKNKILAKNTNVTKTTTQQSSIGFLYHSAVSFFSFIWSFPPK